MSGASPKGQGQDARRTKLPGAVLHERSEPYKFDWTEFEQREAGPKGVARGWAE